jgi:hypothetical protein
VFGQELGWNLSSCDDLLVSSRADYGAYAALYDPLISQPIGAVRGVGLSFEFPHADLFAHHMSSSHFTGSLSHSFTLNGLAVVKSYRNSTFLESPRSWTSSAGNLLAMAILDYYETLGYLGCVLTAGGSKACRFFSRLGFQVIDHPIVTELHALPLVNMAMSFNSRTYARLKIKVTAGQRRRSLPAVRIANGLDEFIENRLRALRM